MVVPGWGGSEGDHKVCVVLLSRVCNPDKRRCTPLRRWIIVATNIVCESLEWFWLRLDVLRDGGRDGLW